MAAVLEAPGPPGSGLNEQMVAMEKWMQRILDNKGVPPLMISRLETADYPSADAPKEATPTFDGHQPPDVRSPFQPGPSGENPPPQRRSWASTRPSRAPSPHEALHRTPWDAHGRQENGYHAACGSQAQAHPPHRASYSEAPAGCQNYMQPCRGPRASMEPRNGLLMQDAADASPASADTGIAAPLGPRLYPRQHDGHSLSQSTSAPPADYRVPFRGGSRLPSPGRLSPGQMSPVPLASEDGLRRASAVPGTPVRREVMAAEVRSRPQYPGLHADRGPPTPGARSSHVPQPSGMCPSRDPSLAMPRAEYLSAPPPQAQPRKPIVQGTSPSARLLGKEGEPGRIRLAPRPQLAASQPATPYGSHVAKPFFQPSPRQAAGTTPTAGRRDILSASTRHMAPPPTTPTAAQAAPVKKDVLGSSTRNRPRAGVGQSATQLPERSPVSVQTFHGPQQTNADERRRADVGVPHRMQVFIAEGKIETASFSNRSDVAAVSRAFLNAHGLKQAVQAGLQAKMESMIVNRETDAYIDLVDLL